MNTGVELCLLVSSPDALPLNYRRLRGTMSFSVDLFNAASAKTEMSIGGIWANGIDINVSQGEF